MKYILYSSISFILIYPLTWLIDLRIIYIMSVLLWIISLMSIIFICHLGYDGVINRFLSSKYWIPISKMALSIYTITIHVQFNVNLSRKDSIAYENFTYEFVSLFKILSIYLRIKKIFFKKKFPELVRDLLSSILPVMIGYLVFEEPFARIGIILCESDEKKTKK